jgi:hypothetical protein
MAAFIRRAGVRLVQLRNLNIDPDYYLARIPRREGEPLGIRRMIEELLRACPGLRMGSYTHPPSWFDAQPIGGGGGITGPGIV